MKDKPRGEVGPNLILNSEVAQALAVIGDRWAFLIIRDIYLGARRFEELRKCTGASRGTLTSRLKSLVEKGILYKSLYQTRPARYDYRLTEKGLDLYPIVLMVWAWDHDWAPKNHLPESLFHKSCGKPMVPIYRCVQCHRTALPRDVSFSQGKNIKVVGKVPPRYQRRSKSIQEKSGNFGSEQVRALDCIGDRWTSLVLAACFFGLRRFDDFAGAIGIATNILADRLRMLVQTGVLDRVAYRNQPVRFEYYLSDKGKALYPYTIALHDWAQRWLIKPGRETLLLVHEPCRTPFRGEAVCSQCKDVLLPHDVIFKSI